MIKKNYKNFWIAITISSPLLTIPLVTLSCSKSNHLQDKANQIYLDVYNELQDKNNYAKSDAVVYNIYDKESLINNLTNNPIQTHINDEFDFRISDIKYDKAQIGVIEFKFDLIDKKTNKVIKPTLDTKDKYYSQILEISGFQQMNSSLVEELENTFQQINDLNLELNENGKIWISDHFNNLNENLFFDKKDQTNPHYFLNYIKKPTINSNSFELSNIMITNKFNLPSIEYQKNQSVNFNFWFTIQFKSGSNKRPLTLNLGTTKLEAKTNVVKTIQFNK